jgi:acetyl esterase/lipase
MRSGRVHHGMRIAALLLAFLVLAGCSPVGLLNVLVPRGDLERFPAIAYGAAARQRLDVYVPLRSALSTPPPVIVFFYGGSWQAGDRATYLFAAEALTSQGFIVVVPDYRVYPEVRYPGFVEDGAAAVAWTRREIARFGGDPSRIYLMGHSAGAHIAAMLAYDDEFLRRVGLSRADVAGFIGLAGPYDFLPLTDPKLQAVFSSEPQLRRTQPIDYVRGGEPPSLLITGEGDTTVKPGNTTRLAARLREKGSRVEERRYPELNHYTLLARLASPLRNDELVATIANFVRTTSPPLS